MALRNRSKNKPMADINVVPYIDVMLVLLIIFMITTPLLSEGVDVDLPQAATRQISTQSQEPMIVTVDKKGRYFLSTAVDPEAPIAPNVMLIDIMNKHQQDNSPVYVRGDKNVAYGEVVKVMALLQEAGIEKVGLMTQSPEKG